MKFYNLLFAFLLVPISVFSQGLDHDFELVEFVTNESGKHFVGITGMELSPDQKIVAISMEQSGPIVLWDWENRTIVKEFDTKGYYAGPKISYSSDGKYLLLEQQFYLNNKPNKDKPIKVEVMDLSTGNIIFRKNNVNDASFVGNSENIAVLIGDDLKVYPLEKGKKASDDEGDFESEFKKKLKVAAANFSFSISPNGKTIAVARKITSQDIKNVASLRTDKKAQKYALAYKYMVDFYDTESLKLLYTSDDCFDLIFDMRFTADGSDVITFSKAHSKMHTGLQGIINLIDASNGTVKRAMFSTLSSMPDYKESPDKKMLGVLTRDTDNMLTAGSILWFDYETARSIGKFDVDMRFKESMATNGRTYFTFLPNGKILSSYGHKLAYITIK